jgi:hypothetical protein
MNNIKNNSRSNIHLSYFERLSSEKRIKQVLKDKSNVINELANTPSCVTDYNAKSDTEGQKYETADSDRVKFQPPLVLAAPLFNTEILIQPNLLNQKN